MGRFLSAAREVTPYHVPLVGINLGHLGFLAQVNQEDMLDEMARILVGKYLSVECILLEGQVFRDDVEVFRDLALMM